MCHPHQPEASRVSKYLPGCSCQDFSYQTQVLSLCRAELKTWAVVDVGVCVCGGWEQMRSSNKLSESSGVMRWSRENAPVKMLLRKSLNFCLRAFSQSRHFYKNMITYPGKTTEGNSHLTLTHLKLHFFSVQLELKWIITHSEDGNTDQFTALVQTIILWIAV